MTKEEKIKRFKQLAKTDDIEEIDASLVEINEEVEPLMAIAVPEPQYEPTAEEIEQDRLFREQKKIRFAQLAGLIGEGDEEPTRKAPAAGRMVLESAINETMSPVDQSTSKADMAAQNGAKVKVAFNMQGQDQWMVVHGGSVNNNAYQGTLVSSSLPTLKQFEGKQISIHGLPGALQGSHLKIYVNKTSSFDAKLSAIVMAEVRKMKMASLSAGLRKEVAKLVKEGKTKISQFPEGVKAKVIKEMQMAELGMAAASPSAHPGYPELDPLINTMGLSIRNTIIKLMDAHGLTDNTDPEMPYKAEYVMQGILDHLSREVV